jgi:hypothetical protein
MSHEEKLAKKNLDVLRQCASVNITNHIEKSCAGDKSGDTHIAEKKKAK